MKDYTYCPQCGTKYSLVQHDASHHSCTQCGQHLWDNPKGAVAVVFLNEQGEILVAERAREPQQGKFDLPGGFIEYNEDPFEATAREVQEETGLHILTRPELLDAYTHDYGSDESVCDLIMLIRAWEGTPHPQDDVTSLHWKPISFIDDPQFAWPYTRLQAQLREIQANVAIPEPAHFHTR